MKNLITLLLVIITSVGYSQSRQSFLDSVAIEMVTYVNEIQKDSGYIIYQYNEDAVNLSEIHTKYMLKHNVIGHAETIGVDTEKYGRASNRRKTLYGDKWWNVTEVIAARQGFTLEGFTVRELAKSLITQYLDSKYHKQAVLGRWNANPNIKKYIGFYVSYDKNNKTLYCTGSRLY